MPDIRSRTLSSARHVLIELTAASPPVGATRSVAPHRWAVEVSYGIPGPLVEGGGPLAAVELTLPVGTLGLPVGWAINSMSHPARHENGDWQQGVDEPATGLPERRPTSPSP
jgi:hypothetical protein